MSKESISQYVDRIRKEAEWARQQSFVDSDGVRHEPNILWDAFKAFRSRPASDDYKATCFCGWESSKYYHGNQIGGGSDEAWAGAGRHLKKVMRDDLAKTSS